MILDKNLPSAFLESCKKDNEKKLIQIIERAKELNIPLNYKEGYLKACRHGILSNIKTIQKNYTLDKETIKNALFISIEYSKNTIYDQDQTYNYFMNQDSIKMIASENLYKLLETACYHEEKDIFKDLLITYRVSIPKDILSYIETLPKESKDFFINLNDSLKLNANLNKVLTQKPEVKTVKSHKI